MRQLLLFFLVLCVAAAGTGTAGAQSPQERRVLQSALDDAALATATLSVAFVSSTVAIGGGEDARLIEDAGTGVLVTPCHVMTARHLLGDAVSTLGPVERTFHVMFTSEGAAAPTGKVRSRQSATLVMQGGTKGTRRGTLFDDWAILELAQPVRGIAPLPALNGACCTPGAFRAAVAGFPGDLSSPDTPEMWVDPNCSVTARLANRIVETDCAATSGNSGGPLMVLSAGGWKFGAMITRAPPPDMAGSGAERRSYALPLDRFLKRRIADLSAKCEQMPL